VEQGNSFSKKTSVSSNGSNHAKEDSVPRFVKYDSQN